MSDLLNKLHEGALGAPVQSFRFKVQKFAQNSAPFKPSPRKAPLIHSFNQITYLTVSRITHLTNQEIAGTNAIAVLTLPHASGKAET
jgi:hypothetical protein